MLFVYVNVIFFSSWSNMNGIVEPNCADVLFFSYYWWVLDYCDSDRKSSAHINYVITTRNRVLLHVNECRRL